MRGGESEGKEAGEEPYEGRSLKVAHFKPLRHTAQPWRGRAASTVYKTAGIGHAGSYKPSNGALLLF